MLVGQALQSLGQMMFKTQEQVDTIVKAMSTAGLEAYMTLARAAVDETGRGVYEDKMTKNIFATEYVYHSIKYDRTVGVIQENDYEDYIEIAEPVGVIAAVTPVTNPTSTTLFKCL
ncbi:MAG: bifunctional acetaldehyde-CoA/alcohol dehydrogenase, partial [Eubacteriales bacterium]|nr:bifunctional acetaldehyde-CoA/alcohol dehydrogenase [Eubacteriales bacterium]